MLVALIQAQAVVQEEKAQSNLVTMAAAGALVDMLALAEMEVNLTLQQPLEVAVVVVAVKAGVVADLLLAVAVVVLEFWAKAQMARRALEATQHARQAKEALAVTMACAELAGYMVAALGL